MRLHQNFSRNAPPIYAVIPKQRCDKANDDHPVRPTLTGRNRQITSGRSGTGRLGHGTVL
jgi:hypothetical protein